MAYLTLTAALDDVSFDHVVGIADFDVQVTGSGTILYVAANGQSGLTAFTLAESQVAAFLDEVALPERTSLAPFDLVWTDVGGTQALWFEPWAQGGMRTVTVTAGGAFQTYGTMPALPGVATSLRHAVIQEQPGGGARVFGGNAAGSGLVRVDLNAAGSVTGVQAIGVSSGLNISALASADIAGKTFLFSAHRNTASVATWLVGPGGSLAQVDTMGAADGIGLTTPTGLATITVDDKTWLVTAAMGAGSISVFEVALDGTLRLRDHVIDDQNTRFASTQALATVQHGGRAFVVAGGSDDGISLFEILPEGRLLHLQTIADTHATTLANIAALRAVSVGSEIQVFVGSGSDRGITQFRMAPGTTGVVQTGAGGDMTGTAFHDILKASDGGAVLNGGDGDDILMDGRGADRLIGGAGRDVFVLTPDHQTDVIEGFQPGIDRIDLSAHVMLRDIGQLDITPTATGATLAYQGEVLEIITTDLSPLGAGYFSTSDLIQIDRSIPAALLSWGFSQTGSSGADELQGGGGDDVLFGGAGGDTLSGGDGNDILHGGLGWDSLFGDGGDDTLYAGWGGDNLGGGDGDDTLFGGIGDDRIWGGAGNDQIWAGGDSDQVWAGDGDDVIGGGNGDDIIFGGNGSDIVYGGAGNDGIWVGADDDEAWGGDGDDEISGGDGNDSLIGGNGADMIWGGTGHDHVHGGNGWDRLWGGWGDDVLDGGHWTDRLLGGPGNDLLTGGADADSFVFWNTNVGADTITDFTNDQDVLELDDALWGGGLTIAEVVATYASVVGADLVLDFGSGNAITLQGIGSLGTASLIDDIVLI
jgi:Ca2+-binding RTX toxin-like protein